MLDLFKEVGPSLLQTKKSILSSENEKEYKPYVVNMLLSQHIDCVLYVNEMNKFPTIDNKLQYDFYLHALVAKKRPFQKWFKSTEFNEITLIKEYFGYSTEKAKQALKILSSEQIQSIADILHKGGVIK